MNFFTTRQSLSKLNFALAAPKFSDLLFTIYYMNFVTTQHSSSKFSSVFAAPKFSYLFDYFRIFAICLWPGGQ